ncbi:GHMP kinase [candidate division KSB1 bacterium]|nr:GHMP kinase [candidate division KSB1 bacterium]RQW03038.1 MAG: GHMP kinase [candidate division KSB1 bacterium]
MPRTLSVSAPGRICLFGEHQDYLGLPVITAAINLRISITGGFSTDDKIRLDCPDVGEYDSFAFLYPLRYSKERDYFKSTLNVLQRAGLDLRQAVDVLVRGNIPINSGTSSSSALVVAWTAFLLKMADDERAHEPETIAKLAHASEVLEFKEPGGMMDHYASALGGVQFISFAGKVQPQSVSVTLGSFVLGDSLEPKDTKGILARVKNGALQGLRSINADIYTIGEKDIDAQAKRLSENQTNVLRSQIVNRQITQVAKVLMENNPFDHAQFGHLLTKHHEQLRDGLGISTPKIERMIHAARDAGALGAKINGSGGGGCMFAYAPQDAEKVAGAIAREGGKAYIVKVDEGVKIVEHGLPKGRS